MNYKIGIDVGGTFTDFLLTSDQGESEIYKVLSTPDDPSVGLMNGLTEMATARNIPLLDFIKNVSAIVHGTTVTTNAVLTRKGAKTGLLTTKGLRDALEMRRGIREEQYNNRYKNVEPLVPRYLRYPIVERLDYEGKVITPLDETDVEQAVALFQNEGIEAVAICFMNSFAFSSHEEKAAKIIREKLPDAYLTLSATFLPSIRFYDRISTTVLNSYVGPILRSYLTNLIQKLDRIGFEGILLIMQSNGGVISPQVAMDNAAVTLLSGPAAGPVAGIEYTAIQGYHDCITVDMGGTSFDAALIKDKTPLVTTEGEINRLRLALPMLGIVTIGAGGGSIGWVDEGGLLRMGPQSAGSKPGPVCYNLGGELPTCTDADLILGYLDQDYFAGGKIPLKYELAEKAIKEKIAQPLGLDLVEAAAGMYRVINVNMAAGVREVSVKRGHDPREFPLVAAGGAGPVHACMIAHELEIPLIIIPKESSIFCAAGMLMSDLKHNFVQTYTTRLDDLDVPKFQKIFREMKTEATKLLLSENIPKHSIQHIFSLDMRYVKQYHEVNVVITAADLENVDVHHMAEIFHPEHNRLFGYSLQEEGTPIELINLRLLSVGETAKPHFKQEAYDRVDPSAALKKTRQAYLPMSNIFAEVPVYDGHKLRYGNKIEGPALIEQINTTTFITPEYNVLCDKFGSYTMYLKTRADEIETRLLSQDEGPDSLRT
ncbi:hydantoinase/oxoprolinase family protein [candidate division CSSED10-310 bacterium]|uniref:Hydantoinase/oxoprolinase family protein n=1 Tax=candidate division CSSED10-310 bacterium TaxID=2855610 RepID=A0ABV6YT91_UNCC1